MAASYRTIDYRVRPAKFAERLMMCDAIRRIKFASPESYQYVGLGSVYFSDFALFHKALGIESMISIERQVNDKQRFLDNLPSAAIKMQWGDTKTELPNIDLSLRSIVWLDYDGRLDRDVLDDVRSIATRATSGSVLAISVQCVPERPPEKQPPITMAMWLADQLGENRVDKNVKDADLLGWGTAGLFRSIILNEIAETLTARNGTLPTGQKVNFEQIFNFHYRDGAHMLTVGGVFFDSGQRQLFDQSAFTELPFVKRDEEPFTIEMPLLTSRELRSLERQLPLLGNSVVLGAMPKRDAEAYVKIYRYFPNFSHVEL